MSDILPDFYSYFSQNKIPFKKLEKQIHKPQNTYTNTLENSLILFP